MTIGQRKIVALETIVGWANVSITPNGNYHLMGGNYSIPWAIQFLLEGCVAKEESCDV